MLKAAIIGGGYVSGRELEQYFGGHGTLWGLLGMTISMGVWSGVYALSLEFARVHRSYEYRSFFRRLLGPGWPVFEVAYGMLILTVLSVLTSVAGITLERVVGSPLILGEAAFMLGVAVLLCFGREPIKKFLSYWSLVLYAAFGALVFFAFWRFGRSIVDGIQNARLSQPGSAVLEGLKYASYNIAAMTAVLFAARNVETRKEALIAGALGGPLAMLPGMAFFLAMTALDPQIHRRRVPVEYLLERLDIPALRIIFLTVMVVTLLGSAGALVHAINERVAAATELRGRSLSGAGRAGIAGLVMVLSVCVARRVGIVALVDKGYGVMAWVFILVFIVPLFTVGIRKISRASSRESPVLQKLECEAR
ncbi:MAG: YkvI family membrane protein [Steroidobacteraceae bacterium]